MGCDIHAYIEVRISDKWVLYSRPRIQRAYKLFGKIAGVRVNDEPPIVTPQGIPADVSQITQIEWNKWEPDAHHAGWLNASQIKEMCEWAGEQDKEHGDWYGKWEHVELGCISGNAVYGVPGSGYPIEYQDVRMVFWFDN